MKEKHKVIMLPTEDNSNILIDLKTKKPIFNFKKVISNLFGDNPQHLYFISDEEIKKGGWFYNSKSNNIFYNDSGESVPKSDTEFKIIATTDKKLLEPSHKEWVKMSRVEKWVPQIPQSFVKEYAKQGGIDEVELEYDYGICTSNFCYQDKCKDICTRLKLTPSNEVIVYLIEEKMYTIKEVENAYDTGYYNASSGGNGISFTFTDWIKENL